MIERSKVKVKVSVAFGTIRVNSNTAWVRTLLLGLLVVDSASQSALEGLNDTQDDLQQWYSLLALRNIIFFRISATVFCS